MDIPQSVFLQDSTPKLKSASTVQKLRKESEMGNSGGFGGVLGIRIHQATGVHNICIYHKQDVYAKLCLTSDPDIAVFTQIINGGGDNPVFNENHMLNVRTADSSLKCEIWMMSRIRNYLEDQLLGFTLVPLSDVITGNGNLGKEFPLFSSDLHHSPAGFVQLSLCYAGAAPEVLEIHPPSSFLSSNVSGQDSKVLNALHCELDKIEFLDLRIANENHMMVSEYVVIQSAGLNAPISESFSPAGINNHVNSEFGINILESSSCRSLDCLKSSNGESPPSCVSVDGSPSISVTASSQSTYDTEGPSDSPTRDLGSFANKKIEAIVEAESDFSLVPTSGFAKSILSVDIEEEQKLVEAEIVDIYMKSMLQFTESLAKMKLPMDNENGSTKGENTGSYESKSNGSRVFYGSNAFF